MEAFEQCGYFMQGLLLMILMGMVLTEIFLLVIQWSRVRGLRQMSGNLFLLLSTYGCMADLMGSYIAEREGKRAMLRVAAHCPVIILIPAILAGIGYLIWMICREEAREHRELSAAAIKQTLDHLPSGICFADEIGRIILCNEKMQQLGQMLTGESLQDYEFLHTCLEKKVYTNGVARVGKEQSLYYFPNGTVWDFRVMVLEEPDVRGVRQVLAVDVTELYFNSEKIRKSNEELVRVNEKLQQLYERIDEQIREEETLAMKIRIHDSFGRSLLAVRQLLGEEKQPEKMKKQLASMKQTAQILLGNMQEEQEKTRSNVREKAQRLGITLFVEGTYPEETSMSALIDQAILECLTNCARHARGKQVFVKITDNTMVCKVRITNSGDAPASGAAEGGGLSTLRKRVEQEDGRMQVTFVPRFELVLLLLHRKERMI